MLKVNTNFILVIMSIIFSIIVAEAYLYVTNKITSGDYSNSIIMDRIRETGAHLIDMTLSDVIESLPDKYFVHPKYEHHPPPLANYERANLLTNFIKG